MPNPYIFDKKYLNPKTLFHIMIRKVAKKTLSRLGLLNKVKQLREKKHVIAPPVTDEVAKYYDKETDAYLGSYGAIIQASKPTSESEFISYLAKQLGLKEGMRLLDAGCGIGGPAVGLAKESNVSIEGITISPVQVEKGRKFIAENGLSDKVNINLGDFAAIEKLYPANSFDVVYFLESFGYAKSQKAVLESAIKVVKQGGYIYIKDFFITAITNPEHKKVQQEYTTRVRNEYLYKVLVLHELIEMAHSLGLYIEFVVPIGIQEDFSLPCAFEIQNNHHSVYSDCIRLGFQIFEVLEVKLRKVF